MFHSACVFRCCTREKQDYYTTANSFSILFDVQLLVTAAIEYLGLCFGITKPGIFFYKHYFSLKKRLCKYSQIQGSR